MRDKPLVHALGFSPWKRPLVRRFLHDYRVTFIRRPRELPAAGIVAVWASGPFRSFGADNPALQRLMLEDGFLRSVGLGADLTQPLSWVVDFTGIYYNSAQSSDLESLLESGSFDETVLARARALRENVLRYGLTKYNIGRSNWPGLSTEAAARGERVLVAGQVETDASLLQGTPGIRSNIDLLRAARAMHPKAWLVYKPHPDVVARLRGSDTAEAARSYCDEIVLDAPMAQLLQAVHVVHVMTSLTGFEALLRGKRVVCHGVPFYAGWGLTEDIWPMRRRSRRLELDELVAGTLVLYPRYVDRQGFPCSAEHAANELLLWKSERTSRLPWWRAMLRPLLRR